MNYTTDSLENREGLPKLNIWVMITSGMKNLLQLSWKSLLLINSRGNNTEVYQHCSKFNLKTIPSIQLFLQSGVFFTLSEKKVLFPV